jgi:membrane-bound metal-dependent hydrolase YbcI (DUF457 family)
MRALTHLAFAGLTGVLAAGFGANPGVAGAAALAAGSLLPDIDSQHSGLGRMIKPLSGRLERRFGHRTLTHSFLGILIFGILTSWLLWLYPPIWIWLLVGVFTHLLIDTANVTGVPLLYPLRLQFWLVANRSWRVPYNSPREFTWLGVIALLTVCILPLSLDGFSPWFHRFMAVPYGAVDDYLQWRDSYEVFVDIKGYNLLTNEDIDGRYKVIDALHSEELLVEDETGRAYTVGLGQEANIHSQKIRAWRGEPLSVSTYRVDLAGRLMADLINALPKGAKLVLVNAEMTIKGTADSVSTVGYFPRVKVFGSTLEARAATIGDLSPYQHLVIENGSAVIRAEYPSGIDPSTLRQAQGEQASSLPSFKSHLLSIPDLPSISGLVVAIGDEVAEGEMVARYINDTKLELSQAELDAAQQEILDLEQNIGLAIDQHEAELQALEQTLTTAEKDLELMKVLVASDAEPRLKEVAAEETVKTAEQAILVENTAWTSKLATLEQSLRDARLTVARAEEQWVKSPVAGVVSDIRIQGVSVKGVTLEVMILERESETLAEKQ